MGPLQLLQEELGGELLTGRQKPEQRQEAVDRFQGGDSDLLLATYGLVACSRFTGPSRGAARTPLTLAMWTRRKIAVTASAWMVVSPATGCSWVWRTSWWTLWWPARPIGLNSADHAGSALTVATAAMVARCLGLLTDGQLMLQQRVMALAASAIKAEACFTSSRLHHHGRSRCESESGRSAD